MELPEKGWVEVPESLDSRTYVKIGTLNKVIVFSGKAHVDKDGVLTAHLADGYVTALVYEEESGFRQTLHRWLPSFF